MSVIWTKRRPFSGAPYGALAPYDRDGFVDFDGLPWNKPLRADLWQPRNPALSRLYWAIVGRVAKGMGKEKEDIDRYLRCEAGLCDVYLSERHGQVRVPRSVKEHECDEMAFKAYFDNCLPVIYGELGIPREALADLLEKKK